MFRLSEATRDFVAAGAHTGKRKRRLLSERTVFIYLAGTDTCREMKTARGDEALTV